MTANTPEVPVSPDFAAYVANRLGKAIRAGVGWKCLCLCHKDKEPSLSLTVRDGGRRSGGSY
jgi:hypothetical protein